MKFVIVGLGSIGSKHRKNLESLGHQVVPCHRDDDLDKLIAASQPDGVLVCTPTSLHLKPALTALNHRLPIFIEKPLSHNLDGVDRLRGKILVGYCLRFDKKLRQLKQQVDQLSPAKIKSVKIVAKSWLPDWHPDEDYRQSYSAKKALGGGVLLDLSHEIDYALWFFGPVKKVSAKLEQAPELKIETEAVADLNLEFNSGVKADIHLSYASREKERYCQVITASERLRWDFQPNNDMYLAEMKHFIGVATGKETPLVTAADGRRVLEVIEATKL